MALPKYGPNKDGGKAVVFGPLMNSPLFEGETTLKKAWERLSKHRRIAYES
jgi:hypothetical protein